MKMNKFYREYRVLITNDLGDLIGDLKVKAPTPNLAIKSLIENDKIILMPNDNITILESEENE